MSNTTQKKQGMFTKAETYVLTHKKQVGIGVGVVAAIVLGWYGYKKFIVEPKAEAGYAAIVETEKWFGLDSFRLVLKGSGKIKGAPFLAEEYSGTAPGNLASYYAGISYLKTGDFKNAIKYLQDVSFDDQVNSAQCIGILGDAYCETGDLSTALSQYLKAAKKNPKMDFPSVHWYKKAARVYEKQNEWGKALEVYQTIKKEFKDSDEATDIDKYISRAETKTGKY